MGYLNGGASLIFRMTLARNVPCWLSERHASALLRLWDQECRGAYLALWPPLGRHMFWFGNYAFRSRYRSRSEVSRRPGAANYLFLFGRSGRI
jgi:hypothetical protein